MQTSPTVLKHMMTTVSWYCIRKASQTNLLI